MLPALPALLEPRAQTVLRDQLAPLGRRVLKGLSGLRDHKVSSDLKGLSGSKDPKALKGRSEILEVLEQLERLERLARLAVREVTVLPGQLDRRDRPAALELQAVPELQALRG